MLKKYLRLVPVFPQCQLSRDTKALLPSATENDDIADLCEVLEKCNDCSLLLQHDDPEKVTLQTTRVAFDDISTLIGGRFPLFAAKLKPNADIVHNPDFESAVVKIQAGKESSLTPREKCAVSSFLLEDRDVNDRNEADAIEETYTQRIMRKAEEQRTVKRSKYRPLLHLCPTSVVVERLFSRAKLIMTPNRRRMDPSTLEMLLLLRCNKDLYDARTVDEAIASCKSVNKEDNCRKRALSEVVEVD
jgi:hypothetical protein